MSGVPAPAATDLLSRAERRRCISFASLSPQEQADRGQYFTPHLAARMIAGLPRIPRTDTIRVLDPGAGVGTLSAALVDRLRTERPGVPVHVVVVEDDPVLLGCSEKP